MPPISYMLLNAPYPIFHFILRSCDCNVLSSLSPKLCLVTLLSQEQCSQSQRFRLQHVQMVNKTSTFKTKLIGNNAETSRVNHYALWFLTFPRSTSRHKSMLVQYGQRSHNPHTCDSWRNFSQTQSTKAAVSQ